MQAKDWVHEDPLRRTARLFLRRQSELASLPKGSRSSIVSGILAFKHYPEELVIISEHMATECTDKTADQHLIAIYQYIVSTPEESERIPWKRFGRHVYDDIAFHKLVMRASKTKSKKCLTDEFLDMLDEEIAHREFFIPENEIIIAFRHIMVEGCEDCRLRAMTPLNLANWALSFHDNKLDGNVMQTFCQL